MKKISLSFQKPRRWLTRKLHGPYKNSTIDDDETEPNYSVECICYYKTEFKRVTYFSWMVHDDIFGDVSDPSISATPDNHTINVGLKSASRYKSKLESKYIGIETSSASTAMTSLFWRNSKTTPLYPSCPIYLFVDPVDLFYPISPTTNFSLTFATRLSSTPLKMFKTITIKCSGGQADGHGTVFYYEWKMLWCLPKLYTINNDTQMPRYPVKIFNSFSFELPCTDLSVTDHLTGRGPYTECAFGKYGLDHLCLRAVHAFHCRLARDRHLRGEARLFKPSVEREGYFLVLLFFTISSFSSSSSDDSVELSLRAGSPNIKLSASSLSNASSPDQSGSRECRDLCELVEVRQGAFLKDKLRLLQLFLEDCLGAISVLWNADDVQSHFQLVTTAAVILTYHYLITIDIKATKQDLLAPPLGPSPGESSVAGDTEHCPPSGVRTPHFGVLPLTDPLLPVVQFGRSVTT
ncbi:hypothetical protein C0J52_22685 [Blattella germanica]|nr:hypothetical protein C0J52_22685 [Blattella germanica]